MLVNYGLNANADNYRGPMPDHGFTQAPGISDTISSLRDRLDKISAMAINVRDRLTGPQPEAVGRTLGDVSGGPIRADLASMRDTVDRIETTMAAILGGL